MEIVCLSGFFDRHSYPRTSQLPWLSGLGYVYEERLWFGWRNEL